MALDNKLPWGDSIKLETFNAETVHLYVQSAMAGYRGLAQNAQFKAYSQANVDNLVMQITSWCAAGRIPDMVSTVTVEWPDGVWQTFKHKFMPKWFTSCWPVRMAKREIETLHNTYFVCPHLETPDRGPHIKFMATGTRLAEQI